MILMSPTRHIDPSWARSHRSSALLLTSGIATNSPARQEQASYHLLPAYLDSYFLTNITKRRVKSSRRNFVHLVHLRTPLK